jgi:uncharacterized SAM-binding protein YcdF (DUF218 family)
MRRNSAGGGFKPGRWIFRVVRFSLLLFAMMWIGGFAWYVKSLTELPPPSLMPTEGIVVLTGGAGRIKAAVTLLEAGLGQRLLISGVNQAVAPEELRRVLGISAATYVCCIDLGKSAMNTQDNAVEAAEWARVHHYRSLRVVTAADHMPRSLVEFRRIMPNFILVPHPIAPGAGLDEVSWPKLALEFSKYIVSLLRARVMPAAVIAPDFGDTSGNMAPSSGGSILK